jgi:2-polyprenyl-3-methyl-5-hydroxy-6-metoxy-1,4-benzoquinol methylase
MIFEDPVRISLEEQLSCAITLWKQLMLHEEHLNARFFLRSLPWEIRNSESVIEMTSITDKCLAHVDDESIMQKIYLGYGGIGARPLPNDIDPNDQHYPRWDFAVNNVGDAKYVLEIGCNDGWLTNRLGLKYPDKLICGVDCNDKAISYAESEAIRWSTNSKHQVVEFYGHHVPLGTWPSQYDVVILFEVYEHVVDVQKLLNHAISFLRPGGKLLLSTPYGSWARGFPMTWATKWNSMKEHLRAPIPEEVFHDMERVGLKDVSTIVCGIPVPDVFGQSTILATGRKQ